jgi:cytochrome b6-f complex iron-sulfur subunit
MAAWAGSSVHISEAEKMNENKILSRHDFLKLFINFLLGITGLLGLGGLMRFFSFKPYPDQPTEFDIGDKDSYPVGSRTLLLHIPAVIYNRNGELLAYSLTCTHLGCTVEEDGETFSCPCHGSRYDRNGNVLSGPAQNPLNALRLEILEDNTLKLYTDGGRT